MGSGLLKVAKQLFKAPLCEIDVGFTEKLRSWCGTEAGFNSPSVLGLLRAWAARSKITVAHIERMHALNKHCFKRSSDLVAVESGFLSAYLRQWMKVFTSHGGADFTLARTFGLGRISFHLC